MTWDTPWGRYLPIIDNEVVIRGHFPYFKQRIWEVSLYFLDF
jgi:hypothetical protein